MVGGPPLGLPPRQRLWRGAHGSPAPHPAPCSFSCAAPPSGHFLQCDVLVCKRLGGGVLINYSIIYPKTPILFVNVAAKIVGGPPPPRPPPPPTKNFGLNSLVSVTPPPGAHTKWQKTPERKAPIQPQCEGSTLR